jgi:membrane fusion protein, multidrug efflux system
MISTGPSFARRFRASLGNRADQIGQYVEAGTVLLSLVRCRVLRTANFKEIQLTRMRAGQHTEVLVDACPDHQLVGKLESFAPGRCAEFNLVPPDNATGNFTIIVPRVPVRIKLSRTGALARLLRPGLSPTVTADGIGAAEVKPASGQPASTP